MRLTIDELVEVPTSKPNNKEVQDEVQKQQRRCYVSSHRLSHADLITTTSTSTSFWSPQHKIKWENKSERLPTLLDLQLTKTRQGLNGRSCARTYTHRRYMHGLICKASKETCRWLGVAMAGRVLGRSHV